MKTKTKLATLLLSFVLGICAMGIFASCNTQPKEDVTVTISKKEMTLSAGESEKLTVAITPTDAKDKTVEWKSSDNTIATVENGTVTAIKEGEVTITVTSNEKSDTCKVTVTAAQNPTLEGEGDQSNEQNQQGGQENDQGPSDSVEQQ